MIDGVTNADSIPVLERMVQFAGRSQLTEYFIQQVATREGKPVKTIEPEVLELLRQYPWPGNVRELQNICERAAILTSGDVIQASLIAPWLAITAAPPELPAAMIEVGPLSGDMRVCPGIVCDGQLTLDDVEREAIVATLKHNNGHRQRSASALGIGVRTLADVLQFEHKPNR